MHPITSTQPSLDMIQVILGPEATALTGLWLKQSDKSNLDSQVLLAAAVLMLGIERPSPAAALSASRSLSGQAVWEGLIALAHAMAALNTPAPLSPVFAALVGAAVAAAAERLRQRADGIVS